tara:strand:+ start:171 stop:1097 length:927 start_codon:yes stop_codon:yes gene_type:complete
MPIQNQLYFFSVKIKSFSTNLKGASLLLRWNKPSGRLILLIPALWSLWLTPQSPPSLKLISLIIIGGICASGAGCIANDLWDRRIDSQVERTKKRPLADRSISLGSAWLLLIFMLTLSFLTVLLLPPSSRALCISLSFLALPPILLYPTAKRWFAYPQGILAICWGFSVLIPWAASESSLNGGLPLFACWTATMLWTFGFDTVYAMADEKDDKQLGLKSSVISLGDNATNVVAICYALCSTLLGISALKIGINATYWPLWFLAAFGMQKEVQILKKKNYLYADYGKHFNQQVLLGLLHLGALVVGRLN